MDTQSQHFSGKKISLPLQSANCTALNLLNTFPWWQNPHQPVGEKHETIQDDSFEQKWFVPNQKIPTNRRTYRKRATDERPALFWIPKWSDRSESAVNKLPVASRAVWASKPRIQLQTQVAQFEWDIHRVHFSRRLVIGKCALTERQDRASGARQFGVLSKLSHPHTWWMTGWFEFSVLAG